MLVALALLVALPAAFPVVLPVVVVPDKNVYVGKDTIAVTLESRDEKPVWIAPYLRIERSEGDGRWTPVYRLQVTDRCPAEPRRQPGCVKIAPRQKLVLPAWDWNTGGDDQCPPRRPGHRAFKGVHRIVADWCEGKAPPRAEPRVKLVTWE